MALISDSAMDAGLDYIANNAQRLVLLSGDPAVFADIAALELASVAIDAADFSKANGDVSGRKLTLAAQTALGSAAGTATHYAIVSDTLSAILVSDTMTNVAITNGGPQDTNAVDVWEISDAA